MKLCTIYHRSVTFAQKYNAGIIIARQMVLQIYIRFVKRNPFKEQKAYMSHIYSTIYYLMTEHFRTIESYSWVRLIYQQCFKLIKLYRSKDLSLARACLLGVNRRTFRNTLIFVISLSIGQFHNPNNKWRRRTRKLFLGRNRRKEKIL